MNQTIVYLHNPAHNGDVFVSSEIVKVLIRSNPTTRFKLVPSCSSILFQDVVSDKVSIHEHPIAWKFDKYEHEFVENDIECIRNMTCTFISYTNVENENRLYINTWCLMTNYGHCMDLRGKPAQIASMLETIKTVHNIELNFDCDDYRELIPKIPELNIDSLNIKNGLKEQIFFYNLNGYSSQDINRYSSSFNDNFIQHLLVENPDKQIIIVNDCQIKHPNLLTLTTDVNIEKTLCGKNLIYYANICRLCSKVYFKLNGGSLYVLNEDNIGNKMTEYCLLYDEDDGEGYSKTITNVYNNNIKIFGDYRKFN